jgi:TonB family protein
LPAGALALLLAGCAAAPATPAPHAGCLRGLQLWADLAGSGNASAAFLLGGYYETLSASTDTSDPRLRQQDLHTAFLWYSRAAELDHLEAINKIGVMYHTGQGVAHDEAQAERYYQRAAERGDVRGESNLGALYMNGDGVPRDLGKGMFWLRKAAEAGNAGAQCKLGVVLSRGGSLNPDYPAAVEWYRKSAEQGYAEAENNLGYAYLSGRGIARDASLAFQWFQKSADQGYAPGLYNLGLMMRYGQGTAKDLNLALSLFLRAADQGDADAYRGLAELYAGSELGAPDEAQALRWCIGGAQRGDAKAQFMLGSRYAEGQGVAKNSRAAVIWLARAAAGGNIDARPLLYAQLARLRQFQATAVVSLRAQPDAQSPVVRSLARGEAAFDVGGRGDWVRIYATGDHAVGYARLDGLRELKAAEAPEPDPEERDVALITAPQPWQRRFPQAATPPSSLAGADAPAEYGAYAEQIGGLIAGRATLPAAVRAGTQQGGVTVVVRIDEDGYLGYVAVLKSSGYCELDQEAVSAVLRLGRFPAPPPGLAEGLRSAGIPVPLDFSLDDGVRLMPYARSGETMI